MSKPLRGVADGETPPSASEPLTPGAHVVPVDYGTDRAGTDGGVAEVPPYGFGKRHVLAILTFLGLFLVYTLRVILSVAIEPMAKEFHWSDPTRGFVLSSFFIGYITCQIPGGVLAKKYGKEVFGFGVLIPSLLTIVTPWCASRLPLMIGVRILTGVGESVTFPAVHALLGRWAPTAERSRLVGWIWSGSYIGTACAFPASGFIIGLPGALGGWRGVFYLSGAAGVLWWVLWSCLVSSGPEHHPTIDPAELAYIQAGLPHAKGPPRPTPWAALLKKPAMWAIICMHPAANTIFYFLLTWLPSFLDDQLHFSLKDSGFLSVLPYLTCAAAAFSGGRLADYLIERGVRIVRVRKGLQILAAVVPTVSLILCSYVKHKGVVVMLLSFAAGACGFNGPGMGSNVLDIAPQYAGSVLGVTNTVGTIPGIVAPTVTGMILGKHPSLERWREVFFLCGGATMAGLIAFLLLASGEPLDLPGEPAPPRKSGRGEGQENAPLMGTISGRISQYD